MRLINPDKIGLSLLKIYIIEILVLAVLVFLILYI